MNERELPISVVIPAFNAEKTIARAIESVSNQILSPTEIIVVDDGSSDGTADCAKRYGVRVLSQPNGGPASARNAGIHAAAQEWIAFLDADDTWLPNRLAEQWEAIRSCPDATLLIGGAIRRYANGESEERPLSALAGYRLAQRCVVAPGVSRLGGAGLAKSFIGAPFINTCMVLVRREVLLAVGAFDASLRLSEDFELWLRLLRVASVCCVEKPLVNYHWHDTNISTDDNAMRLSLTAVWERISARPQRYPNGALRDLEDRLRVILREAIRTCLMRGESNRAREASRFLLRFDRSYGAKSFAACAELAQTRAGRTFYRALRNAWRRCKPKKRAP